MRVAGDKHEVLGVMRLISTWPAVEKWFYVCRTIITILCFEIFFSQKCIAPSSNMSKIWLCSSNGPGRNSLIPVCLLSWSEASLTPHDVIFTHIISGLEEKPSDTVEFPRSTDREDGNQCLVVGKSRSWRLRSHTGACQLCGLHQVFSFSDSCSLGYWTQVVILPSLSWGSSEIIAPCAGGLVPLLSPQSWGSVPVRLRERPACGPASRCGWASVSVWRIPQTSSDCFTLLCASVQLLENTSEESACAVARQLEMHSGRSSSTTGRKRMEMACVMCFFLT